MNIDWTIAGVIVAFLGLIIAFIQLKRTPKKSDKPDASQKKHQDFTQSTIQGETINAIQDDNVEVNQTIINNIRETIQEAKTGKEESGIHIPEFERAKKKIAAHKARLRTYIYAVFASAKTNQLDSKLEVRHVLDVIEELIEVKDTVTLEELRIMKEENIIDFAYREDEVSLNPYTRIQLKSKFYDKIL